jgi:hypothetical protein
MEWPQGVSAEEFKAKAAKVGGAPPAPSTDPSGRTPTGEPAKGDSRNFIQRALDNLVTPDPRREEWQNPVRSGVDDFAQHVAAPVVSTIAHPLKSAGGLLKMVANSGGTPEGMAREMATPLITKAVEDYQEHGPIRGTTDLLGTGTGLWASGEMGGAATRVAIPKVMQAGSALRTAAIGDPDVALARGLGITKSTRSGANALASVGDAEVDAPALDEAQGARPFGKGATSRADLEGKLTGARSEINQPLNQAHDLVANKRVSGPDGPTTVAELERERAELSPQLDALRRNPAEANRMLQNGKTALAAAKERYDALTNAMTPHLDETGIDSRAIRTQDAQVASTLGRIKGKTTLPEEPQPYGFGKIANISLEHPFQAPAQIGSGIRDLVAGRPAWSGRPTDVNIRDAFYNAGPKPTFSSPNPGFAKIPTGAEFGAPAGLQVPEIPHAFADVTPKAEPRSLFAPDQGRIIPATPHAFADTIRPRKINVWTGHKE